jgi:type II secretory pathway pseudopilin PulG
MGNLFMSNSNSKGFTLVESLFALGLGVTFLTVVMAGWYYSTKSWKRESLKSELRYGIEKSLEKLKEDIRLSDANQILFYPAGSAAYTAVSMPRANTDSNGFYTFSSNIISWNQTVVYHVYDNELRRSVYTYNSSSTARQAQLNAIAVAGTDFGAETTTLFNADTLSLSITPTSPTFDGYGSSLALSSNTSFGSVQISAGNHTVRFEVTGKNALSSGYRMGIDKIALTPSGGSQEAESLTISADSGKTKVIEDMSPYPSSGSWSGNYQREYQSSAVSDYITFQTYYDQWLEGNFNSMTHSNTEVTGTDPVLTIMSRENQGLVPAWNASAQTGADDADNLSGMENKTIRSLIIGSGLTLSGDMVRFKFIASSVGDLHITSAYFGVGAGGSPNFIVAPTQLYFNNSPVITGGSDGVGATGSTGPTEVTIPAGYYVWSNWVSASVIAGSDYVLSLAIPNVVTQGKETYWAPGAGTNSFMVTGDSPIVDWAGTEPGYTPDANVHALSEVAVWVSTGTATSQIYDTRETSPAYSQLLWTTNGSGSYLLKARTSNDPQMVGATAWSALPGYSASPASISGIGSGRYAQFQATLTATSPFTTYPELDNVTMTWPGQTAVVEFSGQYTKRPNYGIFKVLVDGSDIVNALEVNLDATKSYQGRNENLSLSAEVKARNSGK